MSVCSNQLNYTPVPAGGSQAPRSCQLQKGALPVAGPSGMSGRMIDTPSLPSWAGPCFPGLNTALGSGLDGQVRRRTRRGGRPLDRRGAVSLARRRPDRLGHRPVSGHRPALNGRPMHRAAVALSRPDGAIRGIDHRLRAHAEVRPRWSLPTFHAAARRRKLI